MNSDIVLRSFFPWQGGPPHSHRHMRHQRDPCSSRRAPPPARPDGNELSETTRGGSRESRRLLGAKRVRGRPEARVRQTPRGAAKKRNQLRNTRSSLRVLACSGFGLRASRTDAATKILYATGHPITMRTSLLSFVLSSWYVSLCRPAATTSTLLLLLLRRYSSSDRFFVFDSFQASSCSCTTTDSRSGHRCTWKIQRIAN